MPRSSTPRIATFNIDTVRSERAAGVSLTDLCEKYGLAMSTLRGRLIRSDETAAPARRSARSTVAAAPAPAPAKGRGVTSTGVETVAQTRARHRAEAAAPKAARNRR